MSDEPRVFKMPSGALCDVPRCGMPATRALIATHNPGHVYFCDAHHAAVTHRGHPMPDARHDPWAENEAQKKG
jgi:hypothetical protein